MGVGKQHSFSSKQTVHRGLQSVTGKIIASPPVIDMFIAILVHANCFE